jgi:hypothetical protein
MTCDDARPAMLAGHATGWPPAIIAHLAACDGCATLVVERSLQQAPAIAIPPTFAVDVARRARFDPQPGTRHVSGATVGLGAAGVLVGIALAGLALTGPPTAVLPVAALLLACGEALVLTAWALDTDVTRARWRR